MQDEKQRRNYDDDESLRWNKNKRNLSKTTKLFKPANNKSNLWSKFHIYVCATKGMIQ